MKLQPRQQILEIWQATARTSYDDNKWIWGGRHGSNSISDAEQLLCLMAPAADVPVLRLDLPDETSEDVLRALRTLGDSVEIPRLLVRVLTEYMARYTAEDGTPSFSGDGYFQPPAGQPDMPDSFRALDVVDSFAASVSLSLAVIGFVRVFKQILRREDIRREVEGLEDLASRRLTAAMVGLLRSFTVCVYDAYSPEGRALCRTANQNGLPERQIVYELGRSLRDINARLRDVTIGSGAGTADDLDNPNRLFECGWSWGVVRNAPEVRTLEKIGRQVDGIADVAPYLYFTVVALDGMAALFSDRTRLLGLLSEDQSRLADALRLRWDLTHSYWSRIATFGSGRWPLEDIPWRTTDQAESDYFSLLVTSIVTEDLVRKRASDAALDRVGRVLVELANRARITRRPFKQDDPALLMHAPGVRIDLLGGEQANDIRLRWEVSDFSPLMLKRVMRIAGLMRDQQLRSGMLGLADSVWDHLVRRKITREPGLDLWDQPSNAFDQIAPSSDIPSWYYARRVVECLITAAEMANCPPLRNERLRDLAELLLSEADHRLDQELLRGSTESGPAMDATLRSAQATLRRAREVMNSQPGTAHALISEVLRDLDRLAAATSEASGGL
jgi:hypothetical protein